MGTVMDKEWMGDCQKKACEESRFVEDAAW
jgi:hypothetical protein